MAKNFISILVILLLIKAVTTYARMYVIRRENELKEFTWREISRNENYGSRAIYAIKDLARSRRSEIPENILPSYNSDDIKNGYRFQDITTYYDYLLVNAPELKLAPLPSKKLFPDSLAEIVLSNFATEKINNLFESKQWWERRIPRKIKGIIHSIDETNDMVTVNIVSFDIYNDFSDRFNLEIGTDDSLISIKSLPILRIPGFKYLKFKITNMKTGEDDIYDCN